LLAIMLGGALLSGCTHTKDFPPQMIQTLPAKTVTTHAPPPSRPRRAHARRHRKAHHKKAAAAAVPAPPIVQSPIPFGAVRRAQMRAYAMRHYGLNTYRLVNPHVIVIHYTETTTYQQAFNTFLPDTPDPELHELPNTCAHFIVDTDGTIHQLVPLDIMCRHTVGLNWTAIGIEHVGTSDQQVLGDAAQMSASLHLVHWLSCRFHISVANVIGHNESLTSPYHHENVAALRTQTHQDFMRADMNVYRARLRRLGGCTKS
jgi:beta-N-acetylhexosaminidase